MPEPSEIGARAAVEGREAASELAALEARLSEAQVRLAEAQAEGAHAAVHHIDAQGQLYRRAATVLDATVAVLALYLATSVVLRIVELAK